MPVLFVVGSENVCEIYGYVQPFVCECVFTHANSNHGVGFTVTSVCLSICLSVCFLHNILKTAAARITLT